MYVASRAPTDVKSGGIYKYQVDARSKDANIEYEIVAGPPAMRINTEGLLTWRTPRGRSEQHEVIIAIKDGNDQQVTHTFTVTTRP